MVQTRMGSLLQESAEAGIDNKLDYDIIMMALPRWDGPYSSTAYSLAKALSKHTRVFYVDNPFTLKTFLVERKTEQIRRRRNALLSGKDIFIKPDAGNHPNLIAVTPRVVVPMNWLPEGYAFEALSRLNDWIISQSIESLIKTHSVSKYVLINSFNPFYGRYFNLTQKPFLQVYQAVDDISESEYLHKHGVRLEAEWMRIADFTIVTSSELKRKSLKNSHEVYLLANAANIKLFQKAYLENPSRPNDLEQIPEGKKVICYMGNICHRIDYDLLVKLARHHHDKILLMIGPFANDNYKTSGLANLPNVIFAGRKDLEQLPAYLKYVDCCIIPFLCNQLTKSIYPLKINEYLSSGKPVVSTKFSEDILSFSDAIYACDDHESFIRSIDLALADTNCDSAAKRVSRASKNNWEDRARQFTDIVEEFLQHDEGHKRRLQ